MGIVRRSERHEFGMEAATLDGHRLDLVAAAGGSGRMEKNLHREGRRGDAEVRREVFQYRRYWEYADSQLN